MNETVIQILSWLGILFIAYVSGKLISKIKLPAILGWLITGMVFGPHLVNLVSVQTLNQTYYLVIEKAAECFAGVMIGSEMVISKLKKYGRSILITTLFQSLGTFLVVSLAFALVLFLTGKPLCLAFIFGGIALATAPAPALSIVKQYHSHGPVTDTLLPMAALDDIVGIVVFFSVMSLVSSFKGGATTPWYLTLATIFLPILTGSLLGFLGGLLLKKAKSKWSVMLEVIFSLALTIVSGVLMDVFFFKAWSFNYLMAGMCASAFMANFLSEEELNSFLTSYDPVLSICLIVVIVNLGMPLDYHTIAGAGLFTFVYILSRALGKYFGAFLGSQLTKAPRTVRNFLGFTLLPHSGVSLVFTGIAVSTLNAFDPSSALFIQGTIASAAIINEIIAVIMAKEGFKWAGELDKKETKADNLSLEK
ncbi:MAG: cation:proton antiporter [Bacilli bacterium]|jgi:Kef-type K+ transport system membrane component KefB|nr:cation:proton antiporter [Bacilli bacterium]